MHCHCVVCVSGSRSFGKTYANEHSSRSHAIFKLVIESRVKDEELSDGTIRVASLVRAVCVCGCGCV